MHDKDDLIQEEYDTSEGENITEIETYEHYGEKIHETEESIQFKGSNSLISSRLNYQFKTKFSKHKTIPVQFQIKIHFNFISISISKIIVQNSFSILHQIQILIKMQETIHLSDLWEHTSLKSSNLILNIKGSNDQTMSDIQ